MLYILLALHEGYGIHIAPRLGQLCDWLLPTLTAWPWAVEHDDRRWSHLRRRWRLILVVW